MENFPQNEESTGLEGGAFKDNSAGGAKASNTDDTQKTDCWESDDNQRLCTDLTDFLMFKIEQVGIADATELAQAVHFIKRESQRLAFGGRNG